ncbi:hypothetical protein CAPTEDRAFT_223899 [Capitella teleta]|uniref:acid phosphatase n=1 Tax=Capitella teleta TaxID=283909 RepID=R7UEB8_CAPTE|nr:hypothetical protein CAPTEDRAFT_223899 [Capitella teleta]|eukprot:ELU04324.1 hypothetical protein CAPTEDRAFT_223899 [Capitella teleta]
MGDELPALVFRHGARSQEYSYPADPNPVSAWPRGYGQLTTVGQQQHYDLGHLFKQRYGHLVSNRYQPDEVYVRSSDYDRTIMSAEANLAAIFPPSGDEVWQPDLPWQPLPVHAVPKKYDNIIYVDGECSRYDQLKEENYFNAGTFYEQNQEFIDRYIALAGYEITDDIRQRITDIWDLYDPLFCQMTNNMTMPVWATEEVIEQLETLYTSKYIFNFGTLNILHLRAGPFFNDLIQLMEKSITTDDKRKITIYSGHDVTLVVYLMAMGVYNHLQAPYASSVIFELHEIDSEFKVKVLFKNDTVTDPGNDPVELQLPGCDGTCTYNEFVSLMRPIVFTGSFEDWNEACKPSDESKFSWLGIILSAVILLVLALAVIAILLRNRHRSRNPNHYDNV